MQFHLLKRNNPNKKSKRVGRGGKRGKTSGRGMKGQKSRAGHRIRPEFRDALKKIPKLRGHGKNRSRGVNSSNAAYQVLNIGKINLADLRGGVVSPRSLTDAGLLRRKGRHLPAVKILGDGEAPKAMVVKGCFVSKGAREKIEAAGGVIDT